MIVVLGRRARAPRAPRVAAISLERSLYIGLCADPQVVSDLDALTAGIGLSIDELRDRLALGDRAA